MLTQDVQSGFGDQRGARMHATKFVESYFDAWNHRDPEGVVDHLAGNGIYCDVPLHEQHSPDDWIESLEEFFSQHRHRYELIGEILTHKHTIAFQYRVFPDDKAEKNDSSGMYRGAEFMTLRGDAAMTITDYYDVPEMVQSSSIAQQASTNAQQTKYARSGLSNEQSLEYKRRLERLMHAEQLYRLPDLTLPKLAEAVGCSVNHLSQVINSGCGMSFFDYLNEQRVQLARELLTHLDSRNRAILDIAFTVGFNSNSAFYTAFKKRVGQTPAQYRRSQSIKSH